MKIRLLPVSQFSSLETAGGLPVSPRTQVVFGYVDADTTGVRNSIRRFFYGDINPESSQESDRTQMELEWTSAQQAGRRVVGTRYADGIRFDQPSESLASVWQDVLREIDRSTYERFFDLNFGEGEVSGSQICFQLKERFQVPFGDVSRGVDYDSVVREIEHKKQKINELNRRIRENRERHQELDLQLEQWESDRLQTTEFDQAQKSVLQSRISKLSQRLSQLRMRACELEEEIEQAAQAAVPAASTVLDNVSTVNEHLGEQIARIDGQILRWKSVQHDIDGRLQDLKSELSTEKLDEFDTGFRDAHDSVRQLEECLLELIKQNSVESGTAAGLRSAIDINHRLCDQISAIQRTWRPEVAKREMNELRRCAQDLAEYVDRLATRRQRLMDAGEDRLHNPGCRCTAHRRQTVESVETDRDVIEQLKTRHADLLKEMEFTSRLLERSRQELAEIDALADSALDTERIREEIRASNQEHGELQDEKDQLLRQLQAQMNQVEMESRLIHLISGYLRELTDGRIQRAYLHSRGEDIVLVDATSGQSLNCRDANFSQRILCRMAVSLGCARLLAEAGYSMPLVWEDAFIGLDETSIRRVLRTVGKYSAKYGQVILLTNNCMVRDLVERHEVPVLDLPDRWSGDSYPSTIPQESGRRSLPGALSGDKRSDRGNRDGKPNGADTDVESSDQRVRDNRMVVSNQQDSRTARNTSARNTSAQYEFEQRTHSNHSVASGESDLIETDEMHEFRSSGSRTRRRGAQGSANGSSRRGTSDGSRGSHRRHHRSSTSTARSGSHSTAGTSSRSTGRESEDREDSREQIQSSSSSTSRSNRRFYLELSDNVESAPTIGPKTAERLENIGIFSVSDLLEGDADWIAESLNHRRIKADDVRNWQQQAMLVCQVPNLRGHDAQLLVACNVTTAEELAEADPDSLFSVIGPFAESKDGQKILRGANEPDLDEVRNWVAWAQVHRPLRSAA